MIQKLLGWTVYPDGIYPGDTSLHLQLGQMNPRFIVQENLGQWTMDRSPGKMQPETGKTHHHCPHPEVHKTSLTQASHTGINHGETCPSIDPGS